MHQSIEIELHQAQYDFCHSDALYRGFVGGRGAGKSLVGAYDLIRRAKPGRLYAIFAPTYPMLLDATYRSFTEQCQRFNFLREMNKSRMCATLGNGAEVLFRSVDDPERARGPNLSGAWLDEASLMKDTAYKIIVACLRQGGEAGWLSATFTPRGKSHWTHKVFGTRQPNTALFHARSIDNPFVAQEFVDAVASQYTEQLAAQELDGLFIDLEGGLAQRNWFGIVDAVPADAKRVRHWDFAATEKQAAGDNPDYTVGTLVASHNGTYFVQHVVRGRYGPGAVERLVEQTAQVDGFEVPVTLEQEPGSSGKMATAAIIRLLDGYNVRAVPVTGDKVSRAMPWLAQAEAGNVNLLRGDYIADWLDEVASFPEGGHDDQVDSMSGAYATLVEAREVIIGFA